MVPLRPGLAGVRRTLLRLVLVAGFLAAHGTSLRGADALDQWLERHADMRTWSAEFRQTRALAVLKEPLVAEGKVWFAAPNLFRWELGSPAQTVAIRSTNELAVIYPRLKRAERIPLANQRGPLRDALTLLEAGFPRSRAELESRFLVRSLTEIPGEAWKLVLQPKSTEARRFMESVTLEFAVAEPGPRATELRFADSTTLRNDFRQPRANPELAADCFTITVPAGFKIVTP